MSKYVSEIIYSIRNEPEAWKPTRGIFRLDGIQKNNISVRGHGNSRYLSVIDIFVDGLEVKCTYFDKWNLEIAVCWWFKNCSVDQIT